MMQIHKVHEGLPLILLLPLYLSFVRAVKLEESASTVSAIPRFPVSVGSIQIPATWNDTSYVLPSLGTNHASDHLSSGTNGFSSAFHTAIRGSSIFPTSTEVAASSGSFLPSQTSTSTFSSILPSPTSKVASSSETSVIKGALVTAAPQSMRLISTAPTESAAIVQVSRFGDTVLDFATNGRAWANDITIPRVKIQAIHQIESMLGNSKNIIENLEGKVPPSLGPCSEAGKRKRFFNPLKAITSLAKDALGLANCIDNIANDISNEIGPLTGGPPSADIIPSIIAKFDAIDKAGKELKEAKDDDGDERDDTSTTDDSELSTSAGQRSSRFPSDKSAVSKLTIALSGSTTTTRPDSSLSATDACPTYSPPDEQEFVEEIEGVPDTVDDVSNLQGRALLRRAKPKVISEINTCTFPNNAKATQPAYLSQSNLIRALDADKTGTKGWDAKVFSKLQKYYIAERSCSSPGFKWERLKTTTRMKVWTEPQANKDGDVVYDANGKPREKEMKELVPDIPESQVELQNIDHSYEKQLVEIFLKSQIGTSDFHCDDMNTLFFSNDQNKVEEILYQLPAMQIEDQKEGKKILKLANTNEGFASLDTSINGAKGHMFGKALDPPSAHFKKDRLKKLSTRIKTIQDYVMLFDIMKDSDFKQMYDATNNRLYQAFTDIDQSITNCGLRKTNGKPFLAHWASRYRTWMEQYLDDVSPPVWQWVSDTLNDLETKLDSAVAPAIIYGEPLDTTAIERHLKELKWIKSLPEFQRSYFKIDFGLTWRTSMLPRTTVNACPGRPLTTLSTGIRSKTGQDSRSNEPSTSATKSGSIDSAGTSTFVDAQLLPCITGPCPTETSSSVISPPSTTWLLTVSSTTLVSSTIPAGSTTTAAPSWDVHNCMPVQNPLYYLSAMVCSCNDGHTYATIPTPGVQNPCGFSTPPGPFLTTMPILDVSPTPENPSFTTTIFAAQPTASAAVDETADEEDAGSDHPILGAAGDVVDGTIDAAGSLIDGAGDAIEGVADFGGDVLNGIFG